MHGKAAFLYPYLKEEEFPQLAPPPYGRIEISRLSYQKPVYLFRERTKKISVVGKVFESDLIPLEEAWRRVEREYFNLKLLREEFGMKNGSYRVVTPLGKNKSYCALLVTEMAPGKLLDYYIAKAIYEHQFSRLFDKLRSLARFFVKLHRTSESARQVSSDLPQQYLSTLLHSLGQGPLTSSQREEIERYATKWWDNNGIFGDNEALVHGDATPTNFFFQHHEVIGIDVEKVRRADRCWDLGFIVAELKHHFMWRMGDRWAAEPYIGHFLWEYAANYGDEQFFDRITHKIPLYMALGLLRIARNTWLDEPHRKNLIGEAKRCLKYGL
jgi:aminoglycoside phosphotransferase (APT) family kinase protein